MVCSDPRSLLWTALSALLALPVQDSAGIAAPPSAPRLVVMLYPEDNDGRPSHAVVDRIIRACFVSGCPDPVEVHSEYLDVSRFPDTGYQKHLAIFLQQKYEGRHVDLVVAELASSLGFALKFRGNLFPGVPIVFCTVEERELAGLQLDSNVIGVPVRVDARATLELAFSLHPLTRQVIVVCGKAKVDAYWLAAIKQAFHPYDKRAQFVYLVGLPMSELLAQVNELAPHSVIYYVHISEDGSGKFIVPADAAELVARAANAPTYSHVDTFVGRGIVGGRVVSFENEARNAAMLALRLLAGEKPGAIGVQAVSQNPYLFDSRQLQRWGIEEGALPAGSVIRFRQPSFWDQYKWHVTAASCLFLIQSLLILGLLVQRANRRQAEQTLRASQGELRSLSGRLIQAQEMEGRRIGRELHDDLNQRLALIAVEMDMVGQCLPKSEMAARQQVQALSARVKELSSTIHELSHRLHPSMLEQVGLAAAIRSLCREVVHAHGVSIQFALGDFPARLSGDSALALYRIVQEAMRNVVKHSQAREARVDLRVAGDSLCLRISDDGVGCDLSALNRTPGIGLLSMRERLRLVGGQMTIDSGAQGGMRIEAHVPYPADQQANGSPQAVAEVATEFLHRGGDNDAPSRSAGGRSSAASGGVRPVA